jgi:hypothetical protein
VSAVRRTLALAVILCLAAAPSAFADTRTVTLADAQEMTCTSAPCVPDIVSVAVAYDTLGNVTVAATFANPLPPAGAPGIRDSIVRINLGGGLTSDGLNCAPVGTSGALSGATGDVRIEAGAYEGGSTASSAARGVLSVVGSPAGVPMTRSVSSDLRTLTVSATSPALANLALNCTQADLADDDAENAFVRDPVPFAWFPGRAPPPVILGVVATVTSPTTAEIVAHVNPGGGPATLHLDIGSSPASYSSKPETLPFIVPSAVTLKLTKVRPGTTFHFRIVLTGGGISLYSADQTFTTDRLVRPAPAAVTAPSILGRARAAKTLTCRPGRWKHAASFAFTWLRDGRRITGASLPHYLVTLGDRGHFLRCRVKAGNAYRSSAAVSRPLRIPRR